MISPSLKPLHNNILALRCEAVTKSPGGIVLPDNAKERPASARVISIGPGRRNEAGVRVPLDIEIGSVVYFAKYSGSELDYDGKTYLVLREEDLFAVEPGDGKNS